MSALKNVQIKTSYQIKHFIEQTSFCTLYTGIDLESSKLVNLSIYKSSKIARDDIRGRWQLTRIRIFKISNRGVPKVVELWRFYT